MLLKQVQQCSLISIYIIGSGGAQNQEKQPSIQLACQDKTEDHASAIQERQ